MERRDFVKTATVAAGLVGLGALGLAGCSDKTVDAPQGGRLNTDRTRNPRGIMTTVTLQDFAAEIKKCQSRATFGAVCQDFQASFLSQGDIGLFYYAAAKEAANNEKLNGIQPWESYGLYEAAYNYAVRKSDSHLTSMLLTQMACCPSPHYNVEADVEAGVESLPELGDLVGDTFATYADVSTWKADQYSGGIAEALGQTVTSATDALTKVQNAASQAFGLPLAYSGVALANEFRSGPNLDLAFNALNNVINTIDPDWDFARLCAGFNRLAKHNATGTNSYLDDAIALFDSVPNSNPKSLERQYAEIMTARVAEVKITKSKTGFRDAMRDNYPTAPAMVDAISLSQWYSSVI